MKKALIAGTLCLVLFLVGCSSSKSAVQIAAPKAITQVAAQNLTSKPNSKVFTLADLKKYNGQNGNSAYIAIDGIVYDVTNARGWAGGMHKMGITAGSDLSNVIDQSPHGRSVLDGLTIVGSLKK